MRGMKAVVGVAILGCALWAGTSALGKVTGGLPIIEANLGHGHEQWEVASGGNAVGGGGATRAAPVAWLRRLVSRRKP